MKTKFFGIIASGALALAASGMASAAEAERSALLISPAGNGLIAIDFANESNALGIQFDLELSSAGKIDIGSCTSGLPKGVLGMCNLVGTTVKFAIASAEPLPTGQIGVIKVGKDLGPSVSVQKTVLADGSGKPLTVEPLIDDRLLGGKERVKR